MQIENCAANELLLSVRKGEKIQEFMDAVSGVKNYRLDDHNRQGHIRGKFAKEIISEQFLLDFDDIISVFWYGVYEHLDKAKLYGDKIIIKTPNGDSNTQEIQNNPINFLICHGRYAVRNYINSLYRKNLEQGCQKCGFRSAIKKDKRCPKCGALMSSLYKFTEDDSDSIESDVQISNIDQKEISYKLYNLLVEFSNKVLGKHTRAYQIMQILIEPDASRDMCAACGLCGADTFDIDMCTNYNANIGRWLGVNKTMIANKICGIRKRLPEWLITKTGDDATYLLDIIPSKYKGVLK